MRINFYQRHLSSLLSSSSSSFSLAASLSSSHRIALYRIKTPTVPRVCTAASRNAEGGQLWGSGVSMDIVSAGSATADNEFGQNLSRRVTVRERHRRHLLHRHFTLFDGDKCTYVIGSDGFVRVPTYLPVTFVDFVSMRHVFYSAF